MTGPGVGPIIARQKDEKLGQMPSIVDSILEPIEKLVDDPKQWSVGTSEDPGKCREARGGPERWHEWDAGSYIAAKAIEEYLLARGACRSEGCSCFGRYVYIH